MKKCLLASLFFLNSLFGAKSIINFKNPRDVMQIVKKYLPSNPVILEAGSYDGTDTVFLARNFGPQCKVYSFEPVPYLHAIAKTITQVCSNITLYNMALADSCGTKPFYLSHMGNNSIVTASSSLLKPKEHLVYAPGIYFTTQIDVECTTIDQWTIDYSIEKIDFLWLDLQGSELDVLKASPNILKKTKAILTEVEFVEAYEGQAMYQELKEWLEQQGFKLIAFNNSLGWYGDALFVRS